MGLLEDWIVTEQRNDSEGAKGRFVPKSEGKATSGGKLPTWASTILVMQALLLGGCGLARLEGGEVVLPCLFSHIVIGGLFHLAAAVFVKENRGVLRQVANWNLFLTPAIPLGIGFCDFGGPLFMWHSGFLFAAIALLVMSRK